MNAVDFAYKPEYSSPLASSSFSVSQDDDGSEKIARSSPNTRLSSYYAAVPSSPPAPHSNDMDVDDDDDLIMARPRSMNMEMSSPRSKSFSPTFRSSGSCFTSPSLSSSSSSASDRLNNRHATGSYKTLYSKRRASDNSAVAALSRAARGRAGMDEQQHRRFIAKCEDRIRRSRSLRQTGKDNVSKLLFQDATAAQEREMFTGEWSEEENRIFISVMQHDWENMTNFLEEDFIPETDEDFWSLPEEDDEIPADILEDVMSENTPIILVEPPPLEDF